jgi:putative phosphoribosyl transferase
MATLKPRVIGIAMTHDVLIPSGPVTVHADLTIPANARSVVIFAHGSGSSRASRRNRWVASELNSRRHATLLVDLLTGEEAALDQETDAIAWVDREPGIRELPIGLFGASTGAAAALFAAARRASRVKAVVSRGGRPDLAESVLTVVEAPTLLIVGENDPDVLALNRAALSHLRTDRRLTIIPGASHLFEEPGALEAAAAAAAAWFDRHLGNALAVGVESFGS